jgi:hypothetical protein
LVPLSRGSSTTHALDEGSDVVFEGELMEDVCADEVRAQCYSSATTNSGGSSSSPWFLNELYCTERLL